MVDLLIPKSVCAAVTRAGIARAGPTAEHVGKAGTTLVHLARRLRADPQRVRDPRRNAQSAHTTSRSTRDAEPRNPLGARVRPPPGLDGVPLACGGGVSQKSVEILIGRLVTDEGLRARFSRDPQSTLRAIREGGLELNSGEVEALLQMRVSAFESLARWVHPRLQKIAFKGEHHEP